MDICWLERIPNGSDKQNCARNSYWSQHKMCRGTSSHWFKLPYPILYSSIFKEILKALHLYGYITTLEISNSGNICRWQHFHIGLQMSFKGPRVVVYLKYTREYSHMYSLAWASYVLQMYTTHSQLPIWYSEVPLLHLDQKDIQSPSRNTVI